MTKSLDYNGAGEYDADVGPAPTQEELDANGDWKGGYEKDRRLHRQLRIREQGNNAKEENWESIDFPSAPADPPKNGKKVYKKMKLVVD